MQQTHVEVLAVGELSIVQVTLAEDGKELISLPVEVEGSGVLAAAQRGIQEAQRLLGQRDSGPEQGEPSHRPLQAVTAPSREDEVSDGHEFPDPEEIRWRSDQSGKGIASAVKTEPSDTFKENVPSGVLVILKDACDTEGIQYRRPRSRAEAVHWIRQIREEGVRVLEDLETTELEAEAKEVVHG